MPTPSRAATHDCPNQTPQQRSRLTEPSSAADFAALLALLVPSVADPAPAIVELGLGAVAAVAGIAAIVKREGTGR